MLVFDIETDGLYENVKTLHCLCIYDTDNDKWYRYSNREVHEGVSLLQRSLDSDITICGHNIINYDIPVLERLYPSTFHVTREQRKQVIDTLVLSRLLYTHMEDTDVPLMNKGILPKKLYKSHSLKAWGYRLGELKGTYGEQENAWEEYSDEMLAYNEQDVRVTYLLYKRLAQNELPEVAVKLEHDIAWLMSKQEKNGFPFDVQKAEKLHMELQARLGELEAQIISKVPMYPDKVFIPKRDNKTLGYKAGVPVQKYKDFNPNSRKMIEWLIRTYYKYTPDNLDCYDIKDEETPIAECRLKIDEETIKYMTEDVNTPEELKEILLIIDEILLLKKRLGQLADGNNAWLSMVGVDGKIHGAVIPNGAVSGRATHNRPNVAQVPHVGSPYGKECRELFNSGDWWQVGIDACGLELRCLAHFMYPYDHGAYGDIILNGDIHTYNQEMAGLETRNQAKTFIYATLYGAGDSKIGKIIGGEAREGKKLRKRFASAVPSWGKLKEAVENTLVYPTDYSRGIRNQKWKRHFLYGLDKRKLHVRSTHSALNLLLQSAGALICKYWCVRTEERLLQRGLIHGWNGDFALMAWVHDEQQIACRAEEIAKIVVEEAQLAMRDTQEFFNFRIQLDTEGKIGHNWYDCH